MKKIALSNLSLTNLFLSNRLHDIGRPGLLPNEERGYQKPQTHPRNEVGNADENNTDVAETIIEVAQIKGKDKNTLVLYLTGGGRLSAEVVLWQCASPLLKQAARLRAIDPLHLLRRFEEQTQKVTQRINSTCSACVSCALQTTL